MSKRLNDTQGIKSIPLHDGCWDLMEGLEGPPVRANPDAGGACCSSYGYRPCGTKDANSGSEGLRSAVMYMDGQLRSWRRR
jgi:hypothetical protein